MSAPHMLTRIRVLALLSLLVLVVAGPIPAAHAQASTPVTVRLISQTPILTPAKPTLKITISATNTGASAISHLQVGVVIGANVLTQTDYEASLTNGPGTPILAHPFAVSGVLAAGATRDLSVELTPTTALIPTLLTDSQVYPLRISVRDAGSGTELGGLSSAMIEIVRTPEKPLRLSWAFETGGPPALNPAGQATPAIEAGLAPTGRLSEEVSAMTALANADVPFDMVVQPSLLEQLGRMTDGYERADGTTVASGAGAAPRAADVLSQLKTAAAGRRTELTAEPFSWPSIPALVSGGLTHDLGTQDFLGRATMSQAFGVSPDPAVTRPPTGALSDQALRALITRSASVVLAQADTVARPAQPNDFAPPPTATVPEGNTSATLVLPDPGTQALLDAPSSVDDPVRAAQITLGELATIWKQEPVPAGATVRGVAITLSPTLRAAFWSAFTNHVAKAPFLQLVTATDLVAQVPPAAGSARLANATPTVFRTSYINKIRTERRDIAAFRSMLPAGDPQPDRLDRNLFVSESSLYLSNEQAGLAWVTGAKATTDSLFASALPSDDQTFTFTSRSQSIPIAIPHAGDQPIKVTIGLQSSRMTFPDGASKVVTLDKPNQAVPFKVSTTAGGNSPGVIVVTAPNGHVIGTRTFVIRSTAFNGVALAITGGAGFVLLLLWARRWFRRPTT